MTGGPLDLTTDVPAVGRPLAAPGDHGPSRPLIP